VSLLAERIIAHAERRVNQSQRSLCAVLPGTRCQLSDHDFTGRFVVIASESVVNLMDASTEHRCRETSCKVRIPSKIRTQAWFGRPAHGTACPHRHTHAEYAPPWSASLLRALARSQKTCLIEHRSD
jgi:hypothetical protein